MSALLGLLAVLAIIGLGIWSIHKWEERKDKRYRVFVRVPDDGEYKCVLETDHVTTACEYAREMYQQYPDARVWDKHTLSDVFFGVHRS
jgi:hypothetical protein